MILVVAVLLSNVMLMAGSSQSETMQKMEVAMATIQKGFLYNHRSRIEKGVNSLREELKHIDSFMIENDKDLKFNAKQYAKTETKALDLIASRIIEGFDNGKKEAVMIDFQHMLNRCVTCHALVRRW